MSYINELVDSLSLKGKFRFVVLAFILTVYLMHNEYFGHYYITKIIPDFQMLDLNFYYPPDEVGIYLSNLGKAGRRGYITLLYLDLLLSITFFLLLATLMSRGIRRLDKLDRLGWLITFPLLRSIMDLLETVSLLICATHYPRTIYPATVVATIATPVKWIFLTLALGILLALATALLYKKIRPYD